MTMEGQGRRRSMGFLSSVDGRETEAEGGPHIGTRI